MSGEIFIDWVTASQRHPAGGLPIIVGGVLVWHDRCGNVRFERASPTTCGGSFDSSIRVGCDGSRVFLSGNPGRFNRQDNLFNLDWSSTWASCNRILARVGLPGFSASVGVPGEIAYVAGARLHRLDLTANYATGHEAQARAVVTWLTSQSVSRVKRGVAGNTSVWWSNTRHMFKAYIKGLEMISHGKSPDEFAVQWCKDRGILRVEIELKRRLLQEIGLQAFEDVSQERLEAVYREHTEILRRVDRSDDPDVLQAIPSRYRMTAAAWFAGQDLNSLMSRATLFRHAKVLREFGLDVFAPRNVSNFPIKIRVVELQAVGVPDWYSLNCDVA